MYLLKLLNDVPTCPVSDEHWIRHSSEPALVNDETFVPVNYYTYTSHNNGYYSLVCHSSLVQT